MSGQLRHSVLPHGVPLRLTATDRGDYFVLLTQTDPQVFVRRITADQFVPNIIDHLQRCQHLRKWGTTPDAP
jgi:hypothetical protein